MSDASAKELLAKKKRAEALKHLETQGQKVSVNGTIMGSTVQVTTDNTLQLVRRQEALRKSAEKASSGPDAVAAAQAEKGSSSTATPAVAVATKAAVEDKHTSACPPLPPGWREVVDAATKNKYYWNTTTNETSWERPSVTAPPPPPPPPPLPDLSSPALPAGWEERIHPATRQKYYFNSATGASSHTLPTLAAPSPATVAPPSQERHQERSGGSSSSSSSSGRASASEEEAERAKKRKLVQEDESAHSKPR